MPLNKSTLSSALENVLKNKPSLAEAAQSWADAYAGYAQNAMSSASSLPTNAMGNLGLLQGAFAGAFQARSSAGAAAAIAAGVTSFWTAVVWTGGTAAGSTIVPGNMALSGSLAQIFADTEEKSESEKASAFADAFDAGAKQVVVLDIPHVQPAPPISGPIS
ncbi:MAG: hypothetical protein GY856_55730 [bacterium]|nr:hypothetical protein [bacterium]